MACAPPQFIWLNLYEIRGSALDLFSSLLCHLFTRFQCFQYAIQDNIITGFFLSCICFVKVHFRGNERILFDYKLSQMFIGDICKLKILRQGHVMEVEVKLDLITSLVPTQLYDKRPR